MGSVGGLNHVLDPVFVGFALVVAAEARVGACTDQLRTQLCYFIGILAQGEVAKERQTVLSCELVGRVAPDHMADFMGQDSGDLGFVFGQQQQSGIDVEESSGQSKRIDLIWIVQYGDGIGDAGAVGEAVVYHGCGDFADIVLESAVGVDFFLFFDLHRHLFAQLNLGFQWNQSSAKLLAQGCTAI